VVSEKAGNARKGIAGASKVSKASLSHLASHARYATHIRKFSPAERKLAVREIKLREPISVAKSVHEFGAGTARALDLTFVQHAAGPHYEPQIQKRTSFIELLVSLRVLTFANEGATTSCER
jgi:hypothetical protein